MEIEDINSINPMCLDKDRIRYPYAELISNCILAGVPHNMKEFYLSDEEFSKVFKMDIDKYLALKDWKKIVLKKHNKLF